MTVSNLKSKKAIMQAIEEFDKIGRMEFLKKYGFGRAKEYYLEYEGKLYDSKAVIGAAHGYEFPDEGSLTSQDFAGGNATVKRKLEELGFKVQVKTEEATTLVSDEVEAVEASISLERDMEAFLATNLNQLESGLKLFKTHGSSGRQVDAKAAGRIDILGIDKKNNLVIVEVKIGEADREVCGQIQAYMGWVKENIAGKRNVRGIIVASDFTDRLRLASKVVPGLALKKYNVKFEFMDA